MGHAPLFYPTRSLDIVTARETAGHHHFLQDDAFSPERRRFLQTVRKGGAALSWETRRRRFLRAAANSPGRRHGRHGAARETERRIFSRALAVSPTHRQRRHGDSRSAGRCRFLQSAALSPRRWRILQAAARTARRFPVRRSAVFSPRCWRGRYGGCDCVGAPRRARLYGARPGKILSNSSRSSGWRTR